MKTASGFSTILILWATLGAHVAAADQKGRLAIDQMLTGRVKPDIYTPLNSSGNYNKAPGGQNFRTVIPGVLYRGGSGSMSGLNPVQLQLFCTEGFSNVTFGYRNGNFGNVACANNSFKYAFTDPNDATMTLEFLTSVAAAVKQDLGPLYFHCWGGHHESGQMAAYALQLFCGFSADQAIRYWDKNSNGDASIGANVHKRIVWFSNLIGAAGLPAKDSRFNAQKGGVDLTGLCPSPN